MRVCRRAGRKVGTKVQGDLTDHTHWDAGIQSALRSTKKRAKCPTHCALISAIQKKTKVWAQDACSDTGGARTAAAVTRRRRRGRRAEREDAWRREPHAAG